MSTPACQPVWTREFINSYLNQLGCLAQRGVQVVAHNTLAASDYGLLDPNTFAPRPNYWAALLWRRLMGSTVLAPGPSPSPSLHLYAHSLLGHPGGVALLVLNTDRATLQSLNIPIAAERYTLSARELEQRQVQLNGRDLRLGGNDKLPALKALPTRPGSVVFAPASVTFLAFPGAENSACR